MSAIDDRTKFLLLMEEQQDSVYPSDAAGNLADPTVPAGVVRPTVVTGTIGGYGRNFVRASPSGFLYSDAADAIRLTRGVTVAAIVRLDIASLAVGNVCTLIQRGRTGSGDPVAFGLRINILNTTTQRVTLQLFWETAAGAAVSDVGVDLYWPGTEYVYLVASREVVDGAFTCRYQVNGDASVGGTTAALDVGGITSADVSIGIGMSGASYVNALDGVIDYIEVLDEAVSAEEMRWGWERIAIDMPAGVLTMRRLVPPGVYSQDPSSRIQRELQVEGRALGHTKSLARRLRSYGRPDAAWGDALTAWESISGESPKAGDSIGERRARLLTHHQNLWTFDLPDIKTQLEESLDLASADIQILEYGNDLTEGFGSGTPSNRALVDPGNAVLLTDSAAVSAGYQQVTATAADLVYHGITDVGPMLYLWTFDGDGADGWIAGKIDVVTLPNDTIFGFAIGSRRTDEWLFVGIAATAGTQRVAYLHYRNGVLDASLTDIAVWATDPTNFWIQNQGGGNYLVKYGANDAAARVAAGTVVTGGPTAPQWAGFCAVSHAGAGGVTGQVRFDDFFVHAPRGGARFNWYAYRNPGLAGGPNMEAARALVRRIKPAHTMASAIQQQAVLCDDATRLTDREPIGA